ncbi:hypothetical protein BGZ95_008845, partial [Linnemannia exigua]
NIFRYGWASNVKIIRATPSDKIHDTIAILDHYVQHINLKRPKSDEPVSRTTFQAPIEIFHDLNPTYDNVGPSTSPQNFESRLARLNEYLSMRKDNKGTKQETPKQDAIVTRGNEEPGTMNK